MWFLPAPGYIVAVAAYSGYLGLAAAIAPGGRWRRLALPAALTIAEAIRFVFPFGGVPLASLGISQAFSPLSQTARLGGVILITWLTFMAGSALSAAWERSWRQAIALLLSVRTTDRSTSAMRTAASPVAISRERAISGSAARVWLPP